MKAPANQDIAAILIETHPLEPFLPKNTKLLLLGSFPPPKTRWKMEFYYPNYQNDMWRIMGLCFFQDKNHFIDLDKKNFKLDLIKQFLNDVGIAIYDTAYQVRRLSANAADKFLQIEKVVDLPQLLNKIPYCHTIATTGDKATDALLVSLPTDTIKPMIGHPSSTVLGDQHIDLYRMPSSSRAYPLALEKKAEHYLQLFQKAGLI